MRVQLRALYYRFVAAKEEDVCDNSAKVDAYGIMLSRSDRIVVLCEQKCSDGEKLVVSCRMQTGRRQENFIYLVNE